MNKFFEWTNVLNEQMSKWAILGITKIQQMFWMKKMLWINKFDISRYFETPRIISFANDGLGIYVK